MKKAELQLPDALYQQVEGLAAQFHMSVPELLCQAAEKLVRSQPQPSPEHPAEWHFPAGRHLGSFTAAADDWRLLANDTGA